jgi:hypothetical protein
MAHHGTRGIVHLEVADEGRAAIGLRSSTRRTARGSHARHGGGAAPGRARAGCEQDKPGIVRSRRIGRAARIEAFESEVTSGAMSGEALFRARARLRVPESVSVDELRRAMESLAQELMVDLELADRPPAGT